MTALYQDRWIRCTDDALHIRGYYFPWGTKRVRYGRIRAVTRVHLGLLSGQLRIWGTASPRYWASLDPRRMSKEAGLVLDTGRFIRPFITPDDVEAVESIVREHAGLGDGVGEIVRGPFV